MTVAFAISRSRAIGIPDQLRTADDDRFRPLEVEVLAAKQLHHARGSARERKPGAPCASRPALVGLSPSTSLPVSISATTWTGSIFGERKLDEDPVDVVVFVQGTDQLDQLASLVSAARP